MNGDATVPRRERLIAGRQVGPIAFGCWRLTDPDVGRCAELVETAVDLGMNLVDNADVYGLDWGGSGFGACEEMLGRVLSARPGLRDRIVLATKGGIVPGVPYVSSADHLVTACEASLRRLGVDHVDLYQVHRPDHFTHPAEVAEALASLHARGLVGAVGVSNHTVGQTRALRAHLDLPLVTMQVEYSACTLDPLRDGVLDLCTETDMLPLAWSPLAGGRLGDGSDLTPQLASALDSIAEQHDTSRSVIALAFVLAHPGAPVAIVGTQTPDRLRTAARAATIGLTRSEVYRIIEASDGRPLP